MPFAFLALAFLTCDQHRTTRNAGGEDCDYEQLCGSSFLLHCWKEKI